MEQTNQFIEDIDFEVVTTALAEHQESQHSTAADGRQFITANTIQASLAEIKNHHIIPVFTKDNETLISHADFVSVVDDTVRDVYHGETIHQPVVRLSHPIKGRIPQAKDKPANQLMEWEKTLYYERMAFIVEVPSITNVIDGNMLSLTIGGVKSYSQDNLYSRSQCDQHFKMFVGFQNKVCTNMCVWSDGTVLDAKVRNLNQLKAIIYSLLQGYDQIAHLSCIKELTDYSLTEQQFAQLIGRCRLYNYLPAPMRQGIPELLFGDTQLGAVCKDYYRDHSFCRDEKGNINLWRLYNLFTGANKTSYIDSFLDKSVNAFEFAKQIKEGLAGNGNWYIH